MFTGDWFTPGNPRAAVAGDSNKNECDEFQPNFTNPKTGKSD
jgi:hypothetical protein